MYKIREETRFLAACGARWWTLEQCQDVLIQLQTVDFSVVEQRRQGIGAIRTFINGGYRGKSIFGRRTRFPGGDDDVFLTTVDPLFQRIISAFVSTLGFRPDNVAKDVKNAKETREENYTEKNQEKQDSAKRMEETTTQLCTMLSLDAHLWVRGSFENRLGLVWLEGSEESVDGWIRPTIGSLLTLLLAILSWVFWTALSHLLGGVLRLLPSVRSDAVREAATETITAVRGGRT